MNLVTATLQLCEIEFAFLSAHPSPENLPQGGSVVQRIKHPSSLSLSFATDFYRITSKVFITFFLVSFCYFSHKSTPFFYVKLIQWGLLDWSFNQRDACMREEENIPYPDMSDWQNFNQKCAISSSMTLCSTHLMTFQTCRSSSCQRLGTGRKRNFGHIYLFVQILIKAYQIPSTVLDAVEHRSEIHCSDFKEFTI